jgi:hypothetical protein
MILSRYGKVIVLFTGIGFLILVITCVTTGKEAIKEKQEKVVYTEYTVEPVFSVVHGIYQTLFTVEVSSETPGALISYTLDCSDPMNSKNVIASTSPVAVTIDPDNNPNGLVPAVILRACAHKEGIGPSRSVTQTYVFLNRITELSPNEKRPGKLWPMQNKLTKTSQQMDYGLDHEVYEKPEYAFTIEPAFLQIPVLSLVSDHKAFFDRATGIYTNPEYHGREWERAVSLEMIDPDGGFQINAGIRIRGGWSRHRDFVKHSFRIFFRKKYRKGTLKYPLFEDEGTDSFNKIDLRTSQNYSWANKYKTAIYNTFLRDIFTRDLQRDMGQPYTRSRFYHLFLNGCYWGLYQSQERPEARYAATYFGGKANDYDVIKVDIGQNWDLYEIEATDGNLDTWSEIYNLTANGYKSDENYYKLEGKNPHGQRDPDARVLVDVDNLIDFMIIVFYTGNFDCPVCKFRYDREPNNFYAIYNRCDKDKGFFFLIHDAEHCMFVNSVAVGSGLYENRVYVKKRLSSYKKFNPQDLHNALIENKRYRARFNERVKKHFFNNGALTYKNNVNRFTYRMKQIDMAIIAESARWGDAKRIVPLTKKKWEWAVNQILHDFFPRRTAIVLKQLEDAGLYVP